MRTYEQLVIQLEKLCESARTVATDAEGMMKRTILLTAILILAMLFSAAQSTAQPVQTKKYVIFRDDDISLTSSIETLQAVNQVHIDENVPVTLAIIPHSDVNDSGNELLKEPLYSYLQSIAGDPLFEFAQHGNTHQKNNASDSRNASEFTGGPSEVQYDAIRLGRNAIRDAFGVTPTTFVPPWDRGDLTTLVALRALGFTEYCTGGTEFPKLKEQVNGIQVEKAGVDLDISGNYDALNKSAERAKNVTDQFLNDPNNDTLIVAYHWWAFSAPGSSADARKVQLLRDYIDYVKTKEGVQFTRLDRAATISTDSAAAASSGLTSVSGVLAPYKLWLSSSVAVACLCCFELVVRPRKSARK